MKPDRSEFVAIRGLEYHCRIWGRDGAPKMFMLHGWMDAAASFQFLVDALKGDWQVIAPDWRGFGLTSWCGTDSYWFPDYLADLDLLLSHYQPEAPVTLLGHSMGGNVACIYAGVRPERVARLINLEGFGLSASRPESAPKRYAQWLKELSEGATSRDYDGFESLAARLQKGNERLTAERALFIARHWGVEEGGRVRLRADPAHRTVNPVLYRLEEAEACWRLVTAAVLWVTGSDSRTFSQLRVSDEEHRNRQACFATLTARVIADAGHMVHHDQPAELARVIEDFLAGC